MQGPAAWQLHGFAASCFHLCRPMLLLLPQVVYPALRDMLGDLTSDHLLAEHQGE
jgi:hypothetical protein